MTLTPGTYIKLKDDAFNILLQKVDDYPQIEKNRFIACYNKFKTIEEFEPLEIGGPGISNTVSRLWVTSKSKLALNYLFTDMFQPIDELDEVVIQMKNEINQNKG